MLSEMDLPLSIKVWLAHKTYDSVNDPKTISATTILKPTKSLVLGMRLPQEEGIELDLVRQIPSAIGTSIHTAIESAWDSKSLPETLKLAGINDKTISRIKINPETLEEGDIPIYMELRSSKEIDGWTITGKFDFICDGTLEDFKSTSVYTWINQSNAEKYIQQGSIYRWLNPDIIKDDYMYIRYIFTDWSAAKAMQDKNYPNSRIISQKYELMSIEETEAMLRKNINNLTKYLNEPEENIPDCTSDELWQREAVFKYYKNPANKTRSTKNFKTYYEAHQKYIEDGSIGEVVEVKGEVVFCKYCNALPICKQAQSYIDSGLLIT